METRHLFILLLFTTSLSFVGCKTAKNNPEPTQEEQVQAVKDLLRQSADNAIAQLSKKGAFLNSDSIKITLPEDIQAIVDKIKIIPQGKALLDSISLQLNRAAENSIAMIKPILDKAIDNLSVEDANKILMSKDAAATMYLIKALKAPLLTACQPIIVKSLDKSVLGITPRDTWSALARNYNKLATTKVGSITNMSPVKEDILDEYVTEQILDTIFGLVAKEEQHIRKHPGTRISQEVVRYFGWLS